MPKKENIQDMFDSIAPEYDKLNHIMSLDIDKTWRKRALNQISVSYTHLTLPTICSV